MRSTIWFVVLVAFMFGVWITRTTAQSTKTPPSSWKIGRVHGDIDLYVIQTANKCFYITHHGASTGLFVTPINARGCQ